MIKSYCIAIPNPSKPACDLNSLRVPLLLCFIFNASSIFAQYTVSGKLVDRNKHPVAYANTLLYKQQDSSLVKGVISKKEGTFAFENIPKGKYFLNISFVGFQKTTRKFDLEHSLKLNSIVLDRSESELEQVKLNVKSPQVVKKVDRLIFNVENTSLSTGSTWDILKQTPGVIALQDKLQIKNTVATVYINDHKVNLTADELKQLLQSYTAANVKAVEVITNPPAKYNAEDGPILNIKTSKMLVPGYKGSLGGSYTQATFAKYNVNTSHYYKTKKLNLFANYSFSPLKELKEDFSFINFKDERGVFSPWRTDFTRITHNNAQNANMNFDYQLDDKNSLSASLRGTFAPNKKFDNRGITQIYNAENQLDSTFTTQSKLGNDLLNTAADISYKHLFDKESTSLSLNFHYTYFEEKKEQKVQTNYFDPQGDLLNENSFGTDAFQKINIYTGQADFETPFESISFKTGAKFSDINSTSRLDFNNVVSDAPTFQEGNLSDRFLYDERVVAGYASAAKDWGKWSTKLGLRTEYTNREGRSLSENQENNRDYTEFFPSAYLSYQAAENHSFAFDYGRKISRPRYESLNPFRYFINENSFQSGNPDLREAISNNFNFNYTYNDAYSFDFYFRDNGHEFAELAFQDNQTLTLRSVYLNVEESRSYGIDFFHSRSIKSWWYAQVLLSGFHEEETYAAIESDITEDTNKTNGIYVSLYNSMTISEDGTFSGDLSLLYISSMIQGSYQVEDMFNLSLGLRKTFWKGRAEVSIHANDIFDELASSLKSTYQNQDNGYLAQPENRYVRLGFKYNFGNFSLRDNEREIETKARERL